MLGMMEGSCDDGDDLCEGAVPREWAERVLERLRAPMQAVLLNGAMSE